MHMDVFIYYRETLHAYNGPDLILILIADSVLKVWVTSVPPILHLRQSDDTKTENNKHLGMLHSADLRVVTEPGLLVITRGHTPHKVPVTELDRHLEGLQSGITLCASVG